MASNACSIYFEKKNLHHQIKTAKLGPRSYYQDSRVVGKGLLYANLHAELARAFPRRTPRSLAPQQHRRPRRAPSHPEGRRGVLTRRGYDDGKQGTAMGRRSRRRQPEREEQPRGGADAGGGRREDLVRCKRAREELMEAHHREQQQIGVVRATARGSRNFGSRMIGCALRSEELDEERNGKIGLTEIFVIIEHCFVRTD